MKNTTRQGILRTSFLISLWSFVVGTAAGVGLETIYPDTVFLFLMALFIVITYLLIARKLYLHHYGIIQITIWMLFTLASYLLGFTIAQYYIGGWETGRSTLEITALTLQGKAPFFSFFLKIVHSYFQQFSLTLIPLFMLALILVTRLFFKKRNK
jgi:hypothetical protein